MVKEITADELQKLIDQSKDGNPKFIIVDYSAVWCGPCKSLGKVLESKVMPKIQEMEDVELVKLDIDKPENREMVQSLGIRGVPTMQFFVDGKQVVFDTERGPEDRIVGFHPQIDNIIFSLIEKAREESSA